MAHAHIVVEFQRENKHAKWEVHRYVLYPDGNTKEIPPDKTDMLGGSIIIGGLQRLNRAVEVQEERITTPTYMKRVYELRKEIPKIAMWGD